VRKIRRGSGPGCLFVLAAFFLIPGITLVAQGEPIGIGLTVVAAISILIGYALTPKKKETQKEVIMARKSKEEKEEIKRVKATAKEEAKRAKRAMRAANSVSSDTPKSNPPSHKKLWILQTWFIVLLAVFSWPLYGIPLIAVAVLLIMAYRHDRKVYSAYREIEDTSAKIDELRREYDRKKYAQQQEYERTAQDLSKKIDALKREYGQKKDEQQQEYNRKEQDLLKKIENLKLDIVTYKKEIAALDDEAIVRHYSFADYEGLTSEECKNKLTLLRIEQQRLIKDGNAISIPTGGDKKTNVNNAKQMLRCFNAECENVLLNLGVKNIDSSRRKIQSSYETLNRIFQTDQIVISQKLIESKLEELNLVYTYELKREQEREQQKAIKEQMLEEEKVRREIEREKAKIEKDQTQVNGEITRMMKYLAKTQHDAEKELYLDKIKELETRLKELESDKETVLEREANAKAGFVYVISNVGSFGEDVYKIGMTRRLEPMDRIKELSSASVPFEFDVHAMIFSNDAPDLENSLHNHFKNNSINKVNLRKEFFKVKLEDVEKHVKNNFNNTAEFTYTALAPQYYQTLEIEKAYVN
jgi:hypothetical protein